MSCKICYKKSIFLKQIVKSAICQNKIIIPIKPLYLILDSKMSMSKEPHKYEVCFVKNSASSEEALDTLNLAFGAMDSNQMEPFWITEEDCLKVSQKESKLYVMDPFEGVAFEHLKTVNCRIVGPLCILYCLDKEEVLPKRPHPVYSVAMRKITVSCSNIDNGCREEIRSKVELMGGLFSKDFTKSVSHLVVGML